LNDREEIRRKLAVVSSSSSLSSFNEYSNNENFSSDYLQKPYLIQNNYFGNSALSWFLFSNSFNLSSTFKARQNLQICFMNEAKDDQQEAVAESSETKSSTTETPSSCNIEPLSRFAFSSPTCADPITEISTYQTQLQVCVCFYSLFFAELFLSSYLFEFRMS
jgi:hypothetical protein